MIFTIDSDNNITALSEASATDCQLETFATEEELAACSANWTLSRLIEIWNSFAGVAPFDDLKPVKKFMDRKAAVSRIWRAIQRLDAAPGAEPAAVVTEEPEPEPQLAPAGETYVSAPQTATVETEALVAAEEPTPASEGATAREGSKKAIVLELLRRPDGATLVDLMAGTGWQAHSVRGFISGALGKKMGLTVESAKREDGTRVYRLA